MCHTICVALAGATLHPQWDPDKMTDESDCRNHYCTADSSICVKLHTTSQGLPHPMFQMTGPNPSLPTSIKALVGHTSLTQHCHKTSALSIACVVPCHGGDSSHQNNFI
ncbi:hypothetical protein AMECASPLE_023477 [Ameca splendens]|uniref:Uncharacterized protein n=1 Tax=Ameca splendens TaxID=208324 RepID=A0ABV0YF80_9TELE